MWNFLLGLFIGSALSDTSRKPSDSDALWSVLGAGLACLGVLVLFLISLPFWVWYVAGIVSTAGFFLWLLRGV